MSWVKGSDTAAFHPIVLRALEFDEADDRTVNELYGFVQRCVTMAAAHEQDYLVTLGTAKSVAGISRYRVMTDQAVRAGYMSWVKVEEDGVERDALKLVEDENLFHMVLKSEREWMNQRKRDARNPELTFPARLRDGDQCRYCGNIVYFGDRKSGRGGTYDHVVPGQGEPSLEMFVVACRSCNSSKKDDQSGKAWVPLPAPAEPYYSESTAAFLAKNDVVVKPSPRKPFTPAPVNGPQATAERPVEQPAVAAPVDQATDTSGPVHAHPASPDQRTDKPSPSVRQIPAGHQGDGTGFAGTGQDVTGRAVKGRGRSGGDGGAAKPPPSHPSGKRRRRPRNRKPS
ncbi:HNH endonuclease [Arthrobacter sp. SX1312]|uniref:HNH endonuclease n=1 Tax=Arthrobacter sp. SX1312 TaxID=2058896 RepID=UPI0011B0E6FE|nr:hypothetical protein [Arthrobacter sp. SX1312]